MMSPQAAETLAYDHQRELLDAAARARGAVAAAGRPHRPGTVMAIVQAFSRSWAGWLPERRGHDRPVERGVSAEAPAVR